MNPQEQAAGNNGVFVGLATLDIIYQVNKLPESGEKIDSQRIASAAGGPAANAAVAFSACGGDATLITKLSDDVIGTVVRGDLESRGVTVLDYGGPGTSAIVSSVMIDGDGERTIVSSADNGSSEDTAEFAPEEDIRFLDTLQEQYSAAALTLMDSYHTDLSRKVAWASEHTGNPMVLDCGREREWTSAQLLSTDVPIVSRAFCGERSLYEVVKYFQAHNCERGIITNGSGAITFWHPETTDGANVGQIMPEHVRDTVDTLGAGDFFHGAFMWAETVRPSHSSRSAFVENVKFASRVAADSIESFGTREWLNHFDRAL